MPRVCSTLEPSNIDAGAIRSQDVADRYFRKLRRMFGGDLAGYWPLNEESGAVAYDRSLRGNHGVHYDTLGQPGIGDGMLCPLFDGSTNYVNIYSTDLNSVFSGARYSAMIWARISGSGVWIDGATRYIYSIKVNSNNRFFIVKASTINQVQIGEIAGGTASVVSDNSLSGSILWVHFALTVDRLADHLKAFLKGAQVGTTKTGLGTWAGSLSSTECNLGSLAQPSTPWSGWLAHFVLLTREATPAEIAKAAIIE
jgi:hypothetical protein